MKPCAPVKAMVDELDASSALQLERALSLALGSCSTAGKRRGDELDHLTRMIVNAEEQFGIEVQPGDCFIVRVPKKDYDATRPPGAPSGSALAKKYASWVRACQAAYGSIGHGKDELREQQQRSQAWSTGSERRQKAPSYTRKEVLTAIRACSAALDRPDGSLTSNRYYDWVAAQRRSARERGAPPPRLPTQRSVERIFPTWARALDASCEVLLVR